MPRGPKLDKDVLKNKLVQHAFTILAQEGTAALNARRLAQQAGCAVGSIYNVFEDIDDIILHANAITLDLIHETLGTILQKSGEPLDTLRSFARGYVDFSLTYRGLWNTLFMYRLPENKVLPDWYREKIDTIIAMIAEKLASQFTEQEEASNAALILWAGLQGICAQHFPGNDNPKAHMHVLARTFVTRFVSP